MARSTPSTPSNPRVAGKKRRKTGEDENSRRGPSILSFFGRKEGTTTKSCSQEEESLFIKDEGYSRLAKIEEDCQDLYETRSPLQERADNSSSVTGTRLQSIPLSRPSGISNHPFKLLDGDGQDGPIIAPEETATGPRCSRSGDAGIMTPPQVTSRQNNCLICNIDLSDISEREMLLHVNECLDTSMTENLLEQERESLGISKETIEPAPRIKPDQLGDAESGLLDYEGNDGLCEPDVKNEYLEEEVDILATEVNEDTEEQVEKKVRVPPEYKFMNLPGGVTVDAFSYKKIEGCEYYFLTHFHSDHYGGLSGKWAHGKIYCSQETARLVLSKLYVKPEWVVGLPFDEKINFEGFSVTLVKANHCPGSALFVFESENRLILHTGDFRACPEHLLHPSIKGRRFDDLYLDTTYINSRYTFPDQSLVIESCAEAFDYLNHHGTFPVNKSTGSDVSILSFLRQIKGTEQQQYIHGKLLIVVGTYSIGKERIALGIAEKFDTLIYADKAKMKILNCLEYPELAKRLTSDPLAAQVHLTSMRNLTLDSIREYMLLFQGRFNKVVALRPTGWNYRQSKEISQVMSHPIKNGDRLRSFFGDKEDNGGRRNGLSDYSIYHLKPQKNSKNDTFMIGVPYSEHSSFTDLYLFVLGLDVENVISTVNSWNGRGKANIDFWFSVWQRYKQEHGVRKVLGEFW